MAARLMLVDDDQNILASVSVALEAEGFEVSTFFDSEMAMIELVDILESDDGESQAVM